VFKIQGCFKASLEFNADAGTLKNDYDKNSMTKLLTLASDPLVGSVKQNAANCSPEETRGKYFSFWSSVPNSVIPLNPIDCTKTIIIS